jgi:TonB family protein
MLYCQQCGADNSDDARFCNQCGAKIAHAGEPGGPIDEVEEPAPREPTPLPAAAPETTLRGHAEAAAARAKAAEARAQERTHEPQEQDEPEERAAPAPERSAWDRPSSPSRSSAGVSRSAAGASSPHDAPPPQSRPEQGLDVSNISLAAIGVRSRGKAWGVIILAVLLLVGVGAGGMYAAMYMNREEPVVADAADPRVPDVGPTEVEIGDALPEGQDAETDVITGIPRVPTNERTPRDPRAPSEPRDPRAPTKNTPREPAQPAQPRDPNLPEAWPPAQDGDPPASQNPSTNDPDRPRLPEPDEPSNTISDDVDWDAMEEEEPTDPTLDEYLVRVRQFIRTYHRPRVQSCFEHETGRTGQMVRGTVVVRFTIQADGTVRGSEVVRNSTELDTLGRCLVSRINAWRLPQPPADDAPLTLEMPFSA